MKTHHRNLDYQVEYTKVLVFYSLLQNDEQVKWTWKTINDKTVEIWHRKEINNDNAGVSSGTV